MNAAPSLSRREREVMDIVFELGQATARQIRDRMAAPPSDPAVRSTLRILVAKGHLRFDQDGPRYVYSPTAEPDRAGRSAMRHVLETFFGGSVEGGMAALLEMDDSDLSEADRARIRDMIERARKEGR